jgi:aminoglycoside phosphotransferase (APT) family kinase protein
VNLIERTLVERFDALALAGAGLDRRLHTVLVTPRFPTSRHVVALLFSGRDRRPSAVAKVPRRRLDDAGIHTEARILNHLGSLPGGPLPGVPTVLGVVDVDGRAMLVETAVDGAALDPALVQRDPNRALSAGADFVSRLPVVRSAQDNPDWYARTIAEPLADLARLVPLDGETEGWATRTHEVLAPLRREPLPAVLEHGDLSHPNLFLAQDGRSLQVIDWERATLDGLPGHDIVFFLQYLSQCRQHATTRPEQLAAFDDAFLSAQGWARTVVASDLSRRGVAPEMAGPLVLAGWARTAGTLAERLRADGEVTGSSAAALADAFRADRDVALWRHALLRAEEGRLL